MKKAVDESLQAKIEKMQRNAYLTSRGIKPHAQQMVLDLLFSETIGGRDDLRHIPNDYARSSIFTARSRATPRKTLTHELLYSYNESITILYTGIELRAEDDEIVWLQILDYARHVPLGEAFEFEIKDLIRDIQWSKNGRNYARVRECISRLKATEILAQNRKAYGTSGAISLIQKYEALNDGDGSPTRFRVWVDKNIIVMFAGNTFTSHHWGIYRKLSPVAKRLADFAESHRFPFPLPAEKFKKICGSTDTSTRSWRQTVRSACKEFSEAYAENGTEAYLNKDERIYFSSTTHVGQTSRPIISTPAEVQLPTDFEGNGDV